MQYFLDAASGFDRAKAHRREASFCVSSVSGMLCSITKKVVLLEKVEYPKDMPRLPEKILTTEKILNPITLDGISLVPLMRQLAIVAKKMYDKYP